MRRALPGALATIAIAWLAITPAGAHHSIARFDGTRIVKVSGVVTGFRWVNPHVSFGFSSSDGQQWVVEMQAPSTMMIAGWTGSTLRAGDAITVFAHPVRQPDPADTSRRVLYSGVVLADGTALGCTQELPERCAP